MMLGPPALVLSAARTAGRRARDRPEPLTPRETDVLRAAQSGTSTEQIADDLSLSPTTVRNYLSNAISKLGRRNRIDAIRIARDTGWL